MSLISMINNIKLQPPKIFARIVNNKVDIMGIFDFLDSNNHTLTRFYTIGHAYGVDRVYAVFFFFEI